MTPYQEIEQHVNAVNKQIAGMGLNRSLCVNFKLHPGSSDWFKIWVELDGKEIDDPLCKKQKAGVNTCIMMLIDIRKALRFLSFTY